MLEEEKHPHIMAVRMYPTVESAVWGIRHWVELAKGIELGAMGFGDGDGKTRRHTLAKKCVDTSPGAGGKELFEDLLGRRFGCYATDLDLPFDQIRNIYSSRAHFEDRIKELK